MPVWHANVFIALCGYETVPFPDRAARSRLVIEAQGNNISGSDTKYLRGEVLHDLFPPFWKPLNGSAYLNHARLPGR
jgi:hypothetical protein